jgi:phosphatidylglycerophosphatase GEP4
VDHSKEKAWFSINIITYIDIRQIDFVRLARAGIRGMAFDKDNCLTRPYEDHLAPELEASIPVWLCVCVCWWYVSLLRLTHLYRIQEAWDLCKRTFPGRVLIVSNSAGTIDDPDDQKVCIA